MSLQLFNTRTGMSSGSVTLWISKFSVKDFIFTVCLEKKRFALVDVRHVMGRGGARGVPGGATAPPNFCLAPPVAPQT